MENERDTGLLRAHAPGEEAEAQSDKGTVHEHHVNHAQMVLDPVPWPPRNAKA